MAPFNVLTVEQIYHITNLTSSAVIYSSRRNRFPISITTGVITHTYDSTGMADTDKLQIIVDDGMSAGGGGGLDTTINTETLSGTKTLVVGDDGIQWLDPGGADRDVVLPAEALSEDAMFVIVNTSDGAGEELVVKNDGGTTILTLGAGMGGMFGCDATDWKIENESGVFYDKITNKVGIGTITPTRMLDVAGNIGVPVDGYINFGAGDGASGYGIFDNSGIIQHKDSGGAWRDMQLPEVFFVSGTPSGATGVEGDIAIDKDTGKIYKKESVATATAYNPADKGANITLSGSDLIATSTANFSDDSVRSVLGVSSGKYYWEAMVSADPAASNHFTIGIGTSAADITNHPGKDAYGYSYYSSSGGTYHNNVWTAYGSPYTLNDIISVALDLDNGKIWFAKNGVWAESGDPFVGTNPAYSGISGTFYGMDSPYSGIGSQITVNYGASAFAHSVPSGFTSGFGSTVIMWVEQLEPTFIMLPDTPSSYTDADGKLVKATSNSVEFVEDAYSEVFFVTGTPSDATGVIGDIAIDKDTGTVYKKGNLVASTTFNPLDKGSQVVLSGGDLVATISAPYFYHSVRTVMGKSSGKWYWEITITAKPSSGSSVIGVGNSSADINSYPGSDADGYGYKNDAYKVHNGVHTGFGVAWYVGSIIMVALDMDAGKVWFGKNGAWGGLGDPGAGTNEAYSGLTGTFYPMGTPGTRSPAIHTANFGATAFAYPVPAGFNDGLGGTTLTWIEQVEPTFLKLADTVSEYPVVAGKTLKAATDGVVLKDTADMFLVSGTPASSLGILFDLAYNEDTRDVWQKDGVVTGTTLNPADKGTNVVLSGGDLIATINATSNDDSVRSIFSMSYGKRYWEIEITAFPGTSYAVIGIGTSDADINNYPGKDAHGYGYYSGSGTYHNNVWAAYGNSYGLNDVISIALDLDEGKIWFGLNGVWQASGDPAAGLNPAFSGLSGTFYSMGTAYYVIGAQFTANFGASAFAHAVPHGFVSGMGSTADTWTKKSEPTFLGLTDTPSVYTGADGKTLKATSTGIVFVSPQYGEMYLLNNTTVTTIDTADVWHMLSMSEITVGLLSGWTYADGVRGTDITTYATSDAGARTKVTTTAAHTLTAGDFISITGTTNYNAIYEVMEVVDSTNFTIDKAWDTNNDATGTYARGGTLTAGADAAGIYQSVWGTTLKSATNNHAFEGGFVVNKTPCVKCRARQTLGVAGDTKVADGSSLLLISAGDKIAFIVQNVGGTADCTVLHGNVNFIRG